jgi:hypothetical protein
MELDIPRFAIRCDNETVVAAARNAESPVQLCEALMRAYPQGYKRCSVLAWAFIADPNAPLPQNSDSELVFKDQRLWQGCFVNALENAPLSMYTWTHPLLNEVMLRVLPRSTVQEKKLKRALARRESLRSTKKRKMEDERAERERDDAGGMQIFVKSLNGNTHTLYFNSSDTIAGFKEKVARRTGIAPDQQRIIYSGYQLEDAHLFSYYKICNNSTVHLMLRIRGGMMHLSSGRIDYVSRAMPHDAWQEDGVTPVQYIVRYRTGPVTTELLTLYAHPQIRAGRISDVAAAECDPNFFVRKSAAELKEIAPAMTPVLSTLALARLLEALMRH